jgi:hypothetical protein
MSLSKYSNYIDHLARIYGLPNSLTGESYQFLYKASSRDADTILNGLNTCKFVIAVYPDIEFVNKLCVSPTCYALPCRSGNNGNKYTNNLQSYFPVKKYAHAYSVVHSEGSVTVCDESWFWIEVLDKKIVFIGTDFIADQIQLRQGDPDAALNRPDAVYWGIAGERPNYLYDNKLNHLKSTDRSADDLMMRLVGDVSNQTGLCLSPLLPNCAPGAVVITGDDDQAELSKYDEQLEILGDLPITYFLHPKTRHTQKTLKAMQKKNRRVDFGIHPDALDEPSRYSEIFDEQVAWFKQLTGYSPLSVRNHGFLNDGYWGHLDSWLKHGVVINTNLPGFDGNIMNGSLLPTRMFWKGELVNHWSILTAIGDGIRFAGGLSDEQSAECMRALAARIRADVVPGVVVLNLHPQNVTETKKMHLAVRELVDSGFLVWNMKDCLNWFEKRDSVKVGLAKRILKGIVQNLVEIPHRS